ncbi:MAG: aminodeoxychorismate synthase component I, partial [Gammaproteobacteria bacterium]
MTAPPRPFVLLDDSLSPGGRCALFRDPVRIIRCDDPATAGDALRAAEAALADGFHLAGFLGFELGYLLEPRLAGLLPARRTQPLLWLGVFAERHSLAPPELQDLLGDGAPGPLPAMTSSVDRAEYLSRFERAKRYIADGDVYQVNLTFPQRFRYTGDPLALYRALRRRQPVRHGALIAADDFHVLSFSPELFLDVRDGVAAMRPMKGTIARGRTPEEDSAQAAFLKADAKSRAENLMILDLMRNDLGRVAEIGSVSVSDMFTVETYRTLHQMTSGVAARLRPGIGVAELMRHVFPCGSVTGAPKIRAMEVIRELEDEPRGVYTGAVGAIAPDGAVDLNVAIRTLFVAADGAATLGIGSGIVQDSDGPAEYDECLLKARFLTQPDPPFRLIETMRWRSGDGYWLLDEHMARLAASAGYFGFPCDIARARALLAARAADFREPMQRVRLTLDEDG